MRFVVVPGVWSCQGVAGWLAGWLARWLAWSLGDWLTGWMAALVGWLAEGFGLVARLSFFHFSHV